MILPSLAKGHRLCIDLPVLSLWASSALPETDLVSFVFESANNCQEEQYPRALSSFSLSYMIPNATWARLGQGVKGW